MSQALLHQVPGGQLTSHSHSELFSKPAMVTQLSPVLSLAAGSLCCQS